jgi:hypothetical protein
MEGNVDYTRAGRKAPAWRAIKIPARSIYGARKERLKEIEGLLEVPAPPSVDEIFEDPAARSRIGEWISLSMNRATRRRRNQCRKHGP